MLYYSRGSKDDCLLDIDLEDGLYTALEKLRPVHKVLAIPPDFTRFHSGAGRLTELAWKYYRNLLTGVLPALGTHTPMTEGQIGLMFGATPKELFIIHNWKKNITTLGMVPSDFIHEVSEGKLSYSWPAQVNTHLVEDGYDLILSIGQVVPHEVTGMANHNKNIFIGTGGEEGIHKSHFLGAVYGMERLMGKAGTPVRAVLDYASRNFAGGLPIVYVLTVIEGLPSGKQITRGLFIGDDEECFLQAAALSASVNITCLEKPLSKVVVYLDPDKYKSAWLGNKSIYRTRMAIRSGGELVILAPGMEDFGEDRGMDRLIRKYGYHGTEYILEKVKNEPDLSEQLSAAAHLIHGSTEGRFSVTCCPGSMRQGEIESVGYGYQDIHEAMNAYNPDQLQEGFNTIESGEKIYYISDPGMGLWTV